ncbi:MAG: ABC-F family ATP-binding cassette domain-containing protein [Evtepia sp.]
MLLSAEHISKNYGTKQLLEDVSLYLNEKDRIGIVGVNGTGKSTLLKILSGLESSDTGTIVTSPNSKLVYLPQNPIMRDDFTVLEQVFEDVSSEYRELNEYEAKSMLNRLGIREVAVKIGTLSGGQRKRVALAAALVHPSNVLILDEPTNHLDSEMVCWLEEYLGSFNKGLIMVTHDRYFLERVVNRIVEVSHAKLYSYEANYSKYLQLKAERAEMNEASERKRQTLLRREYQWVMRGPRARGTKSRERLERYAELKDRAAPETNETVQLMTQSSRLGNKIIELQDVSKRFEERTVIDHFSYMVRKTDRIGIVGRNGAGKSTLLNMIAGRLVPDTGCVDVGLTVKIGYFMQECREMDESQRVYDFIRETSNEIKTKEGTFSATQMLERFLFSADLQYTTIGRLSGGERRRLYLLSILMDAPNILLLDEPTNDLDIETLTILEDYLETFPGAVIAVAHDRYFLDKIATSIFEVSESGTVVCYTGNYSDYTEKRPTAQSEKKKLQTVKNAVPKKQENKPVKLKFSFKEQREFETIDAVLEELEIKLKKCLDEMGKASSDYVKLQALMAEKETLESELEERTERWVYLNEQAEKIRMQK